MRAPLLALALLVAPAAASAYCRTTTCGAQPDPTVCPACGTAIAWDRSCIALRVDPRVLPTDLTADAFHAEVVGAAAAWSSALCPGTTAHPSFVMTVLDDLAVPAGYVAGTPNVNSVSFRDHWSDDAFHAPDAAAITIVTFTSASAVILDADTELNLRGASNPAGFVFATDGRATAADLATILTHEVGHTQGLAHSNERSAVMWYTAGRGEQRRVPTDDDRAGICTIYPPRAVGACTPDPGLVQFGGGGLSCDAAGRARGSGGWVFAAAALAALGRGVRDRRAKRV